MDKIFVESKKSQNCKRADMTLGIAFERGEILLPRSKWGQTYTFDKMWIIDRVANLGKMIER